MKTLTRLFMLCIITGLLTVSCNKDDDESSEPDNGNQQPSGSTLTCKVNGTDWSATLAVVATSNQGIVTITGSDSNAGQCFFSLNNVDGAGDYQLGGNLTNPNMGRWTQGIGQNDTYTTTLGQGSGTVTISEITDTGFNGTFSFNAKNQSGETVNITEGEFNATFSE